MFKLLILAALYSLKSLVFTVIFVVPPRKKKIFKAAMYKNSVNNYTNRNILFPPLPLSTPVTLIFAKIMFFLLFFSVKWQNSLLPNCRGGDFNQKM